MSSDQQYQKALERGRKHVPAITDAEYIAETDTVVIHTRDGTLVVPRGAIEEFRHLPQKSMKQLTVSPLGLHVDDVDVNGAGLVTMLANRIAAEVADSY
ncbi:MAG TPA: hypothetical protein VN802_19125 [Stellaceae bacterium]|nr:hypothetical protein [Stellaceae bacterium]